MVGLAIVYLKKEQMGIKKRDEFLNSEEGKRKLLEKRLKNKLSQKRKDVDVDCIDYKTYFISSDDRTLTAELLIRIKNIIDLAGHEMVYIGKTSNPFKRMTGKNMSINESFTEYGLIQEVKDHIPSHTIPHQKNNYKKMYVLAEVRSLSVVNGIEISLIEQFWDTNRNKTKGGEGANGGAPYYIYVVVHEDSKMFTDTAS